MAPLFLDDECLLRNDERVTLPIPPEIEQHWRSAVAGDISPREARAWAEEAAAVPSLVPLQPMVVAGLYALRHLPDQLPPDAAERCDIWCANQAMWDRDIREVLLNHMVLTAECLWHSRWPQLPLERMSEADLPEGTWVRLTTVPGELHSLVATMLDCAGGDRAYVIVPADDCPGEAAPVPRCERWTIPLARGSAWEGCPSGLTAGEPPSRPLFLHLLAEDPEWLGPLEEAVNAGDVRDVVIAALDWEWLLVPTPRGVTVLAGQDLLDVVRQRFPEAVVPAPAST